MRSGKLFLGRDLRDPGVEPVTLAVADKGALGDVAVGAGGEGVVDCRFALFDFAVLTLLELFEVGRGKVAYALNGAFVADGHALTYVRYGLDV